MASVKITKENYETEVLRSDKPVLIDFWASWCGPCRTLGPILEEISEENEDIKVCKVNVDEENELAANFGISSIPTIVVMKNGQIANKAVGVRPKADVIALVEG